MGEILKSIPLFVHSLGALIEYIGVFIIALSVFVVLVQLITKRYSINEIRAKFARDIIFGLEFIIAADILLVTVAANLNEILQLGGIVLIRIMLGYSLRKEASAKS